MKVFVLFWFAMGLLCAAGKVIRTALNQHVTLPCAAGNTFRSLSWDHRGTLILSVMSTGLSRKGSAAIKQRSKVVRGSDLHISAVKKEDAGAFRCTVDGRSEEYTLLVTSVSAKPPGDVQPGSDVTLYCDVAGLGPGSTVQWTRPDGRPHVGAGPARLSPVAATDAGTWVCKFSCEGETFTESLDIQIEEPATPSAPPSIPAVHDQPPCTDLSPSCPQPGAAHPHQPTFGPFVWWVWVAIGVGVVLMVLLMVCILVLRRNNRRRKRKLQKIKNIRQSQQPRQYCQCNCLTAAARPQQGRQNGRPSTLPLKPLLMQ